MNAYTTQKAAALAQRLAEQQAENERLIAAIRAERAAHDKRLADALEHAGPARVAFVEDLLEKLGIEPVEHEPQRNKRTGEVVVDKRTGRPRMIDPDPHETTRMQRLAAAIDDLLAATGDAADQPVERTVDADGDEPCPDELAA